MTSVEAHTNELRRLGLRIHELELLREKHRRLAEIGAVDWAIYQTLSALNIKLAQVMAPFNPHIRL